MPDSKPASGIAVIVVSYNSGRYLERCLATLASQTVAPRRVVVVDNASSDDSVAICRRFPDVELVVAERNLGFAAGNNLGISRVPDCEWVALLNPDAFAEPNWIETLTEAIARHPDVTLFASRLVSDGNPEVLDGAGDAYASSGAAWQRWQGAKVGSEGDGAQEVFGACGAAVLYRRAAFVAAGGFDESYFCYYEDVDMSFRMQLLGHRCLYLPEAHVRHVGSGVTGPGSDFSCYHAHRNVVWTYFKNMPGGYLWWYLPRHLLLNIGTMLSFTARGRFRVIARAKWHALKGLPRVLAARRELQRARRVTPAQALRNVQRNAMLGGMFRRAARRLSGQTS